MRQRTDVIILLSNCTKWKASTQIVAPGSFAFAAARNAAHMSIDTVRTPARQAGLRRSSHVITSAVERPST
jgi:hypothetical protein